MITLEISAFVFLSVFCSGCGALAKGDVTYLPPCGLMTQWLAFSWTAKFSYQHIFISPCDGKVNCHASPFDWLKNRISEIMLCPFRLSLMSVRVDCTVFFCFLSPCFFHPLTLSLCRIITPLISPIIPLFLPSFLRTLFIHPILPLRITLLFLSLFTPRLPSPLLSGVV